jgi:hypothetical protein
MGTSRAGFVEGGKTLVGTPATCEYRFYPVLPVVPLLAVSPVDPESPVLTSPLLLVLPLLVPPELASPVSAGATQ